ncbi:MAG: peptidoglycan-binding protein [Clostridia bacterium]|nr:peptidoglycan-binding protein [Clostridia bacterium]
MKRLIALLLVLLLLPVFASAELKRGDRGEEVKELQQILIELGFLEDKADGIFGKKTEKAVKALQEYWGVNTTGRLDDDDLMLLYDLYYIVTGEMEFDGLGEDELSEIYPAYCSWEGTDEWGAVFCYRHQEEYLVASQIAPNPPKKLEEMFVSRLCELWEMEIELMYDEWAETDPDAAEEQREIFEAALEAFEPGREKMEWLEAQGIDLCFELHGAEKQAAE